MRKILLTLAALICVMLMGCAVSDEQNYLAFRNSEFSVCVKGNLELARSDGYTPDGPCAGIGSDGRDMEFEARLTAQRTADGKILSCVEFTSPPSLTGLKINYTESGVNFSLNGQKTLSSGELNLKIPNICSAFYIGETVSSVNPQMDGSIEIYIEDSNKSINAIYIFDKDSALPKELKATTEDFKLHLWYIGIPTDEATKK